MVPVIANLAPSDAGVLVRMNLSSRSSASSAPRDFARGARTTAARERVGQTSSLISTTHQGCSE